MWLWVIALLTTLIGLATAGRGVGRAAQAVARLRVGAPDDELADAVEVTATATSITAAARRAVEVRSRHPHPARASPSTGA